MAAGAIAQGTSLRVGLLVLPAATLLAAAALAMHRRQDPSGATAAPAQSG